MKQRMACFLAFVAVLCLFSSCSVQPRFKFSRGLPKDYYIEHMIGERKGQMLSEEFILIADNQVSNLYPEPCFLRSPYVDMIENVAIRPIQLDYFSRYILSDVVFKMAEGKPIIHLGDACNYGCTGEFRKFLSIMKPYQGEWFMVPGNHDMSFFGNLSPEGSFIPLDQRMWARSCMSDENDRPITKQDVVSLYLEDLFRRNKVFDKSNNEVQLPSFKTDAEYKSHFEKLGKRGEEDYEFAKTPGSRRHTIAWSINSDHPTRSFVVQKVNMELAPNGVRVQAILFDTAQYPSRFWTDTAIAADILEDQFKVAERWVDQPKNSNTIYIFMGHHPFSKLRKEARKRLNQLRIETGALTYVSADLHKGQYRLNQEEYNDVWLELNLGSLTDWPGEMRKLQVYDVDNKCAIFSHRVTLEEELRRRGVLEKAEKQPSWRFDPYSDAGYLVHKIEKPEGWWGSFFARRNLDYWEVDRRIKIALLRTHWALIENFKTESFTKCPVDSVTEPDECDAALKKSIEDMIGKYSEGKYRDEQFKDCVGFLKQLEEFDEKRKVKDEDGILNFRLGQAYWASKAEEFNGGPTVLDDRIITPHEVHQNR